MTMYTFDGPRCDPAGGYYLGPSPAWPGRYEFRHGDSLTDDQVRAAEPWIQQQIKDLVTAGILRHSKPTKGKE